MRAECFAQTSDKALGLMSALAFPYWSHAVFSRGHPNVGAFEGAVSPATRCKEGNHYRSTAMQLPNPKSQITVLVTLNAVSVVSFLFFIRIRGNAISSLSIPTAPPPDGQKKIIKYKNTPPVG